MKYNSDIEIWFPLLHSNDKILYFPKYNPQFTLAGLNPYTNSYIYINNSSKNLKGVKNGIYFKYSTIVY